jgi:hypothetical protein
MQTSASEFIKATVNLQLYALCLGIDRGAKFTATRCMVYGCINYYILCGSCMHVLV